MKALLVILLACGIALVANIAVSVSAPSGSTSTHGLKGHYYTRSLPGSYDLKGFLVDDYGIPVGNKEPDAIRVDAQLAFGWAPEFVHSSDWWTPEGAGAIVWKGYIRLPKAGTYYFPTVSSGASTVYVNHARVALNGDFGGSIPSANFSYKDSAVPEPYAPKHGQYAVPIVAATPRVLPIEVRYMIHDSASKARGIYLYWVTPDSPRDATGKAIASIVPSEALFVEPPEPVYQSAVSGPHSTISSDMLYLPTEGDEAATLTIRVADKQGHPVPNKRVVVSSLRDGGGTDTVVQPTTPTNAQGITTAQFKTSGASTTHLFATVVEEAVDVGQAVEIIGQQGELAFLPLTYSPYYDGEKFKVEPLPMRVGHPVHIRVPLMNRKKEPYELTVKVLANPPNIGMFNWTEVGRTETFVLKPGESREVKVTWVPTEAAGHLCFKVEVWGGPVSTRAGSGLKLISTAFAADAAKPLDSRQRNFAQVARDKAWEKIKDLPKDLKSGWDFARRQAEEKYGDGIPTPVGNIDPRTGRWSTEFDIGEVNIGGQTVVKAKGRLEAGATPGSDPTKDIADFRAKGTVKGFGISKSIEYRAGVRISDEVQRNVSAGMGGVGSQSGAAVRRSPGCDMQSTPEQC